MLMREAEDSQTADGLLPSRRQYDRNSESPTLADVVLSTSTKQLEEIKERIQAVRNDLERQERERCGTASPEHVECLLNLGEIEKAVQQFEGAGGQLPSELSWPSPRQEHELFLRMTTMYERFLTLAGTVSSVERPSRKRRSMAYVRKVLNRADAQQSDVATQPADPTAAVYGSLKQLQEDIFRIREYLMQANKGLVYANMSLVCRSPRAQSFREDLESAANVGLMNAVDGFDCMYGTRFSTLATKAIRNTLRVEMVKLGLWSGKSGLRLPAIISLQQSLSGDDGASLMQLVDDKGAVSPGERIEISDELEAIRRAALDNLQNLEFANGSQRQRAQALMTRVLGLDGHAPEDIADVAKGLRISRSLAQELFNIALKQIGVR